jgi:hypothetical protein
MKIRTKTQAGSITMIATLTVAVIGVSLASYLTLTSRQNVATTWSQYWTLEIPVAEAGIEEALTHLYHNGPSNLTANGWAAAANGYTKTRYLDTNSYYVVRITTNANPQVIAQGYVRKPMDTTFLNPRTVQVSTRRDGTFMKGMVAKGSIDFNGKNVRSDSFDSVDPLYSTLGRYDPAKFKDNGDVASNASIIGIINQGNADIYGHVSTGPGGSVSVGANGAAGSKAWIDGGNSGVQSGWFTDDMNVSFPDVTPPFSGGAFAPVGGNLLGTNYSYIMVGGNYQMSSLTMNGGNTMLVTGNSVLYVTGDVSLGGNASIVLAPGATLRMYVGGANADLGGNGVVNGSGNALNFSYFGLPSNTSLAYSGNGAFTGTLYAPSAAFRLGGGGSDTFDFSGASVTGTVVMNGHYNFHYDENLGRNGPRRGYVVTNWVEL